MFVVDASVALSWVLLDERSGDAEALRDPIAEAGICVPSHWSLEVTNALLAALRRKRLSLAELQQLLPDLRVLIAETDRQTDSAAWSQTLELAESHGLSLYDAAYLELAIRRRLPLASLDRKLLAAGSAAGITVLP